MDLSDRTCQGSVWTTRYDLRKDCFSWSCQTWLTQVHFHIHAWELSYPSSFSSSSCPFCGVLLRQTSTIKTLLSPALGSSQTLRSAGLYHSVCQLQKHLVTISSALQTYSQYQQASHFVHWFDASRTARISRPWHSTFCQSLHHKCRYRGELNSQLHNWDYLIRT